MNTLKALFTVVLLGVGLVALALAPYLIGAVIAYAIAKEYYAT